jgi:hypothetical protein
VLLNIGGFVTLRLVFVEVGLRAGCAGALPETLRACAGGWMIGCGPRLPACGAEMPDERAGYDGVIRVG